MIDGGLSVRWPTWRHVCSAPCARCGDFQQVARDHAMLVDILQAGSGPTEIKFVRIEKARRTVGIESSVICTRCSTNRKLIESNRANVPASATSNSARYSLTTSSTDLTSSALA